MKCVVLLSGGVDSTTCLAMALTKYKKEDVLALTAYYGQKHAKELEAARKVAAYYGVQQQEVNLSQAFSLSDCSLLQGSHKAIAMNRMRISWPRRAAKGRLIRMCLSATVCSCRLPQPLPSASARKSFITVSMPMMPLAGRIRTAHRNLKRP